MMKDSLTFVARRKSLSFCLRKAIWQKGLHFLDFVNLLDDKRKEKITYENWLDRMLTALEYYAFYANRDYLTKEMSEFYMSDIEDLCEEATKYQDLMAEIHDQKEQLVYCERRQYYDKFIGKKCYYMGIRMRKEK